MNLLFPQCTQFNIQTVFYIDIGFIKSGARVNCCG